MSSGAVAIEEDRELISKLFGSIGKIWKAGEKLFDAIIGLNGSGPAYIFFALEALADGGVAAGLPRDLALGLASQAGTRFTVSATSIKLGEDQGFGQAVSYIHQYLRKTLKPDDNFETLNDGSHKERQASPNEHSSLEQPST